MEIRDKMSQNLQARAELCDWLDSLLTLYAKASWTPPGREGRCHPSPVSRTARPPVCREAAAPAGCCHQNGMYVPRGADSLQHTLQLQERHGRQQESPSGTAGARSAGCDTGSGQGAELDRLLINPSGSSSGNHFLWATTTWRKVVLLESYMLWAKLTLAINFWLNLVWNTAAIDAIQESPPNKPPDMSWTPKTELGISAYKFMSNLSSQVWSNNNTK